MNANILLVEDEPGLVLTLTDRLTNEGYAVEAAGDGVTAVERAASGAFELVILDIALPRKSGLDVCRDLRQRGVTVPILMLTARNQTIDKVLGLKIGADDYVTKPFDMLELLARVEALLRRAPRSTTAPDAIYEFGDVRVDVRGAEALRDGKPVPLSAREFQLLTYFIRNRGEVLSRERLLHEVWGYAAIPSTRTVDVHVTWLRQKLEANPKEPCHILTVYGFGYKFVG
ncbi:MAG TPA: response regulator transcription factor [Bryobacteraceae bacterium]|nr:response regulator transcription factor [Bryobacteraceae bacterium]